MKKCGHCKQGKDESEFYKNRCKKDGLEGVCKDCKKLLDNETKEEKLERKTEREIKLLLENAKTTKVCTKCGLEKNISEFNKSEGHKCGVYCYCKKCRSILRKRIKDPSKILPENMKRCHKCGLIKDKSDFSKNKSNKDGLHSECKKCNRKYKKENKNGIYRYSKEYRKHNKNKRTWYYKNIKESRFFKRIKNRSRRMLGLNPINKRFKGAEGHHLRFTFDFESKDNDLVVYIPKELHRSISHNGNNGRNMLLANKTFLEWYLNNTPIEERDNRAVKLYWNYCVMADPYKK